MDIRIDLHLHDSHGDADCLRRIEELIHNLGARLMAAIDDLNTSLDNLKNALDANTAELVLLKSDLDAAVAAGNQDPVITAAKARVDQMITDLQAADTASAPAP